MIFKIRRKPTKSRLLKSPKGAFFWSNVYLPAVHFVAPLVHLDKKIVTLLLKGLAQAEPLRILCLVIQYAMAHLTQCRNA